MAAIATRKGESLLVDSLSKETATLILDFKSENIFTKYASKRSYTWKRSH